LRSKAPLVAYSWYVLLMSPPANSSGSAKSTLLVNSWYEVQTQVLHIGPTRVRASRCGGPLLNAHNGGLLVQFVTGINDHVGMFGGRTIIQTNGLFLGSPEHNNVESMLSPLVNFRGKVVFEVSIKSANPRGLATTTRLDAGNFPLAFKAVGHLDSLHRKLKIHATDFVG